MTSDTADTAAIARDHAQDAAAGAKDQVQAVSAHAQDAAHDVAATASEQAHNVQQETVRQVRNLRDEAASSLSTQTGQQTQRLAGGLRELGKELKGMADGGQQGGTATELAHQAADRAHSLAGYLEGKEPSELLADLRDYARRSPGVFLAGAGVLGLLAGRVGRGVKDAGGAGQAATPTSSITPTSPTTAPGTQSEDIDLPAVDGFTSSTSHFTAQDPVTGALLPDPTLDTHGGQL